MDTLRDNPPLHARLTTSRPALDRVLLLLTVAAPFVLFLHRPPYAGLGALPLAAVLLYFRQRDFALFAKAVFWPLFYVALVWVPWPLCFVLPLALYFVAYGGSRRFRHVDRWLTAGRMTGTTVALMAATIIVSSGALLTWVFVFHPHLDSLARMIPPSGPLRLAAMGVAFSTLNALWEELILKGLAWSALQDVFRSTVTVNLVQSALFGFAHFQGFPQGWTGVLMAAVYAFVLGIIRKQSRGLLAPIVTHVFADATIFVVLYFISIGRLSAT
ncbi:hypothetical protein BLA39750_03195 [Burkholderia lata]|uniref:CAAX prenyl protease 2/Lysostaphin resistance protein A-like domain-containing protein n=1 Tax=Burkholderia lata (strain ATCC 17760 / DSM 23089 / LMG 22485 / NCIMB 9086 / R18194 / 383) TaxID=482957 RepID=A0A6P2XMS8_BURL3|nr:CPBP family intramembrane glutamic endopeptidase [Burkholderia lata]VWD10594.1 hypothetical protein BLA39750_03195 [Burkholderia lata]